MFNNSVFDGKGEESGYEVIKHLYKSYNLMQKVLELDKDGIYGNMARILIDNIFKMNESILNGLKIVNEKRIVNKME